MRCSTDATVYSTDSSRGGPRAPVDAHLIAEVNYFGSEALLDGLRPALAASDAASVVQIGSNSTTLTPNLPDELVDAFLGHDRATIDSVLTEAGAPFNSAIAYGASKAAITRWCRRASITDEWVGQDIRLNVIAPGAVQTPLLKGGDDDPTFGPLTSQLPVPTGRAEPADIAAWIVFMLSPAARFACGSVVFVDGERRSDPHRRLASNLHDVNPADVPRAQTTPVSSIASQ